MPATLLQEQLSYMKRNTSSFPIGRKLPAAIPQEEECVHRFRRKKNTCSSFTGSRIPAILLHEEEYIQLSYIKETTNNYHWEKLKVLHHEFSKRWKNEYLQELHKRYKWQYPERDIEKNDLVLVKEDNLPPNEWKMGRVVVTYIGDGEHVRVADIKTCDGLLTRPITKLCVLPIERNS